MSTQGIGSTTTGNGQGFDTADREARFTRAGQHLDAVISESEVIKRSAAETQPRNSRYGRMIPQAADGAIEMVRGCSKPFVGLSRDGKTIDQRLRYNTGKAQHLQAVLGKLDDARALVQGELNATNNEISADLDDCRQTMMSNLDNPAARGPEQDQLSNASTKFRSFLEVRSQSSQATRATTGTLRGSVKEKAAEVAGLGLTVAQQEVELKFHTGAQLTPEDVIITPRPLTSEPAPVAPRTRRRPVAEAQGAGAPEAGKPAGGRRKTSR